MVRLRVPLGGQAKRRLWRNVGLRDARKSVCGLSSRKTESAPPERESEGCRGEGGRVWVSGLCSEWVFQPWH